MRPGWQDPGRKGAGEMRRRRAVGWHWWMAALCVVAVATTGCAEPSPDEKAVGTTAVTATATTPPTTAATTVPPTTTPPTTAPPSTVPATTQPPPTAPPRTSPPPQPAPPTAGAPSGCHPSYDPCVPITSDVDCAGGSGNGPAYVGRVTVIGPDVYGLDNDGDGVGCEAS